MCTADEINSDLTNDLTGINREIERATAMKTVLDQKKEALTKQLNDLTPK